MRKVQIYPNKSQTIEVEIYLNENLDNGLTAEQAEILNRSVSHKRNDILSGWVPINTGYIHRLNGDIYNNKMFIKTDEAIIRLFPNKKSKETGVVYKGTTLRVPGNPDKQGKYIYVEILSHNDVYKPKSYDKVERTKTGYSLPSTKQNNVSSKSSPSDVEPATFTDFEFCCNILLLGFLYLLGVS